VVPLAFVATLALAAAPPPAAAASGAGGDPAAGRRAFEAATCSACHETERGVTSTIGPNLFGVVGRDIASLPGFDYSEALRALPGTWDAVRLDRYLSDPEGVAPGTRMGVDGIGDPRERADLVAYLSTLREGAAQVAAPARDFGPGWPAGAGQVETGRICSACHSLAIVKQQRLSRARWDKLLDWMVAEQGMAAPPPEQRALILDYLEANFGPPR
jgi:cytochrome c